MTNMNDFFELASWQKKQATLLYQFSSLDYLKQMQVVLKQMISYAENMLDEATAQNRDLYLTSERWGTRETSENWARNARPFLKAFQLTTARQIAERSMSCFNITGLNQFEHGISEYSMNWATDDEEEQFKRNVADLSRHARRIDSTLDKFSSSSGWDDFDFTHEWGLLQSPSQKIPKFNVRTDVIARTNDIPLRTGVYVSATDPHASLQFAWHGGKMGKILLGNTFNSLGLAALASVGRANLWTNDDAMLAFVLANISDPLLTEDSFYKDSMTPELAPSLVARNAFTAVDTSWFYVELVNGVFEEIDG